MELRGNIDSQDRNGVQLKTILNWIQPQPGFVYGRIRLIKVPRPALEIEVRARRNGAARCSQCGKRAPGYDRLQPRRFEFVPLWGIAVFLVYALRRVSCAQCGVRVERVPWGSGKRQLTDTYAWFLAGWAKRLSWKEVAAIFHTSWEKVYRSVEIAVEWGRKHQSLEGIEAIGVDEIQWQRGHRYLTLVYQIDAHCRRLLWVGRERETRTLQRFFDWFGEDRSRALRFICSDMWRPYLRVIAARAAQAAHVLDRFHIMKMMGGAIDDVRAAEVKALKRAGHAPVLTRTRWLLLKRPEHLSDSQAPRLADLLRFNLRSVRAYLLLQDFQFFWGYRSPYWAGRFLDAWCTRAMRSRMEPMKKVARTLRRHRPLLLNWFRAKGSISAAVVEGFNNKAKLTMRKAYGFRTDRAMELALYHALGALPEPVSTHRFC